MRVFFKADEAPYLEHFTQHLENGVWAGFVEADAALGGMQALADGAEWLNSGEPLTTLLRVDRLPLRVVRAGRMTRYYLDTKADAMADLPALKEMTVYGMWSVLKVATPHGTAYFNVKNDEKIISTIGNYELALLRAGHITEG